jgi:hypothetical protein
VNNEELFGVRARCKGMAVYYDLDLVNDGIHGTLSIHPKWSKTPKASGDVYLRIDEHMADVVPELLREAWDGMLSDDPGYSIPRWVKDHFRQYEQCSNGDMKQ